MLDSGRLAGYGAVVLSAFALSVNFLFVPYLINKITAIRDRVDTSMSEYKAVTEQAWSEMMMIRSGDDLSLFKRQIPQQQNPNQQWNAAGGPQNVQQNTQPTNLPLTQFSGSTGTTTFSSNANLSPNVSPSCPAGQPGPPGQPGIDGMPGDAGQDGQPGKSGWVLASGFDEDGCVVCVQGPPGPIGFKGPSGPPGEKGWPGLDGTPGSDGWPGALGAEGNRGMKGIGGVPGGKGVKGKPAPGGKGDPGPKGARGPIGRAGPQGNAGKKGLKSGLFGPFGKKGSRGLDGLAGIDGKKGAMGEMGMKGGNAHYCPCPKEMQRIGSDPTTAALGPPGFTNSRPPSTQAAPFPPSTRSSLAPAAVQNRVLSPAAAGGAGNPGVDYVYYDYYTSADGGKGVPPTAMTHQKIGG